MDSLGFSHLDRFHLSVLNCPSSNMNTKWLNKCSVFRFPWLSHGVFFLKWNQVGDNAVVVIAKSLEEGHLAGLAKLKLQSNNITGVGLQALTMACVNGAAPKLSRLNVSENEVEHVGLQWPTDGMQFSNQRFRYSHGHIGQVRNQHVGRRCISILCSLCKTPNWHRCLWSVVFWKMHLGVLSFKTFSMLPTCLHC